MKKSILLLSVLAFSLSSQAQKIKYKDIFPILDSKNYDQGMPQLNTFLSDPKNAEHANANLQKALYYENLINGYHLINDSSALIDHSDSAVIYFNKSKVLITEKELKKKDEYYQAFHRRDLRTGEFGIKVSDVHLDIEKKMESIKKLKKNAIIIYGNLYRSNISYNKTNEEFKSLVGTAASENEFLILANEEQVVILDQFINRASDIKTAFQEIRNAVSKIRIKGYSPELELIGINDFLVDGRSSIDIFQNDVKVWDYGTWAEEIKRKIERDVYRMRNHIKRTYEDLTMKSENIKSGSVIPYEELTDILDPKLIDAMHQFEDAPLPEKLLNILIEDTKYRFLTKPTLNTALANEDDVIYQLALSDSLREMTTNIMAIINSIDEPMITGATKKHPVFLKDNYGGDFGLLKYQNQVKKKYEKAQLKWQEKLSYWQDKSKWGVSADLADSIYLIGKADSLYEAIPLSQYYTIAVSSDDSSFTYAIGIEFTGDKDQGFITRIGKDMIIQWKENFDLGEFQYSDSAIMVLGDFIASDEGKISSYIFSYVPETPTNIIIVNVDKAGTFNWSNELSINRPPVTTKFNSDVKETYLYYISEEEMETYDGEDAGYIVIDRRGKTR